VICSITDAEDEFLFIFQLFFSNKENLIFSFSHAKEKDFLRRTEKLNHPETNKTYSLAI